MSYMTFSQSDVCSKKIYYERKKTPQSLILSSVRMKGLLRYYYLSTQSCTTSTDIPQSNIPTLPPRSAYQLNDPIRQFDSNW